MLVYCLSVLIMYLILYLQVAPCMLSDRPAACNKDEETKSLKKTLVKKINSGPTFQDRQPACSSGLMNSKLISFFAVNFKYFETATCRS